MAEAQAKEAREEIPFLPGIFDAMAKYDAGKMSGKEATLEALQSVAGDAAFMVATWGIYKGSSALGRKIFSQIVRKGLAPSKIRDLGLNVVEEKFKLNWKNPDVFARGMEYEDLVVPELEKAGISRLAPNTNTFDAFNKISGHAVSIKSLNTQTPAKLLDPKQLEYAMDSYVRKVKGVKIIPETKAQRFEIKRSDVLSSEIRIGVPKATNMDQWLSLQKSAMKAEKQGIKITFGIEK